MKCYRVQWGVGLKIGLVESFDKNIRITYLDFSPNFRKVGDLSQLMHWAQQEQALDTLEDLWKYFNFFYIQSWKVSFIQPGLYLSLYKHSHKVEFFFIFLWRKVLRRQKSVIMQSCEWQSLFHYEKDRKVNLLCGEVGDSGISFTEVRLMMLIKRIVNGKSGHWNVKLLGLSLLEMSGHKQA